MVSKTEALVNFDPNYSNTYIDPITGQRVENTSVKMVWAPPEEQVINYDPTQETGSGESLAFTDQDFEYQIKRSKDTLSSALDSAFVVRMGEALSQGYDPLTGDTLYNTDQIAIALLLYANATKWGGALVSNVKPTAELMKKLTVNEREIFMDSFSKWASIASSNLKSGDEIVIRLTNDLPQKPTIPQNQNWAELTKTPTMPNEQAVERPSLPSYIHPMLALGLIPRR